jgi:integrase
MAPTGQLIFDIDGAKVTDTKGQPRRTLTVADQCPEAEFLRARINAQQGGILRLPMTEGYADAFGQAVRRAARQSLGPEVPFSPYMWRHGLAADLKADGVSREAIALALGHAATETAAAYGRTRGGRKGVRQIVAEATRVVRVNHRNFDAQPEAPVPPQPALLGPAFGMPARFTGPTL